MTLSNNPLRDFLAQAKDIIGAEHVVEDPASVSELSKDPVPNPHHASAYLYPASTEEVAQLVKLASSLGVKVWTNSCGRNWGYGNQPHMDSTVIFSLVRMNKILYLNEELGYVVVEPGVSYQMLYDHLKAKGSRLWIDCIGGTPGASVLGNSLDRGVGVTPYGDHYASLCGLQVVLSDGTVTTSSPSPNRYDNNAAYCYKWGVGPFFEGIFTQSNYGIVTHGGIWLLPAPEYTEMFALKLTDQEQMPEMIDAMRELVLADVIPDKVRFTNDISLLTVLTQRDSDNRLGRLSESERQELADKFYVPQWSMTCGIYGSRSIVRAKRKVLKKALSRFGKLRFFNQQKINLLEKIYLRLSDSPFSSWLATLLEKTLKIHGTTLMNAKHIFGVFKGIPTELIIKRAYFKSKKPKPDQDVHIAKDDVGLIWFAPVLTMEGTSVTEFINCCREKFQEHDFDFYVTGFMSSARSVVILQAIIYDKEEESQKAIALYQALSTMTHEMGYKQFRSSTLGWDSVYKGNPELEEMARKIKSALDPASTFAPGLYGIE